MKSNRNLLLCPQSEDGQGNRTWDGSGGAAARLRKREQPVYVEVFDRLNYWISEGPGVIRKVNTGQYLTIYAGRSALSLRSAHNPAGGLKPIRKPNIRTSISGEAKLPRFKADFADQCAIDTAIIKPMARTVSPELGIRRQFCRNATIGSTALARRAGR